MLKFDCSYCTMVGLGEIKNMSIDANKKQKLIDLLNNYVVNGGDVNNLRKGDFYPTPVSLVTCAKDLFYSVLPIKAIITDMKESI